MQPVLAEYPFSPVHCYLRHFSCIILSADKMTYQTIALVRNGTCDKWLHAMNLKKCFLICPGDPNIKLLKTCQSVGISGKSWCKVLLCFNRFQ